MKKFVAGPCVIESAELLDRVAETLVGINERLGVNIIFKASFDKANRTSLSSYRGVGLDKGLQMLSDVKQKWGLSLCTDIHESWQAAPAGEVIDVLQIPAFLCRQTDLLVAAASTGRIVNIKKAQFLSGEDNNYEKTVYSGHAACWLSNRGMSERGTRSNKPQPRDRNSRLGQRHHHHFVFALHYHAYGKPPSHHSRHNKYRLHLHTPGCVD